MNQDRGRKIFILFKTELQVLRVALTRIFRNESVSCTKDWAICGWGGVTGSLLTFSVLVPLVTSCSSSPTTSSTPGVRSNGTSEPVPIAAAENFWGSIATQLGGDRVKVTSIITNPKTDPHDYEPKPTDARTLASVRYVIVNGAGYDPWSEKLLNANPVSGRKVLNVGELVGKKEGDNPHLWYSPEYVMRVVDQISSDLKSIDPADSPYFDRQRQQFVSVGLKDYNDTISTIKQKYKGTPVASTESIFAYMAQPLELNLTTPPKFMTAIAEGQTPTAADKATFDEQVTQKQVKVFIYNSQNATPDTDALKQKAQAASIPIVPITETLTPATASFQAWQVGELKALQQALANTSK